MAKVQFQVLYREFLFRMVDRELLSAHAQGDANKLLGRFATILICVSIPFAAMALGVGNGNQTRQASLISAWDPEHALVATTMLVVGLFAVLSWDSTLPERRDVLVLAPLPVRAGTILLAKAASLATALALAVATFNAAPGLAFPLALAPPGSNLLDMVLSVQLYRTFAAYWITMAAAGSFILCCVLCIQGIAAQLPRALFLRLSSLLQIATFCVCVGAYFLQPSLVSQQSLVDPLNQRLLGRLPSYWFLGLFQQLNGIPSGPAHPTLATLAARAWTGLAVAAMGAAAAFLLCYFRTLRKVVEEPDIAPGSHRPVRLPRFGNGFQTAIVQFSIRTLFRSRQHRVILSFYSGMGFAIVILFMKTPVAQKLSAASASDPWHQVSLPLLASSFVMMCTWVVGVRVAFAMPSEPRANWIFRVTPLPGTAQSVAASRRALYAIALAPFCAASATVFFCAWPWRPAAGHVAVLGILSMTIAELCLHGFRKIPFTCSYLPGTSNLHVTLLLCLMLGLNVTYWGADFERRALSDPAQYAWMFAILTAAAVFAWRRTEGQADSGENTLRFEEEAAPAIVGLGLHRDGVLPIKSPLA